MDSLYQSVKAQRLEFQEFEVTDYPEEFKRIINNRVYPKACHDRAIRFLINSMKPEYKLIQAKFMQLHDYNAPDSFNLDWALHSVVEIKPGIVYDGVFNRLYQEDPYFEVRGLRKHCVWTAADAVAGSMASGLFVKIDAKPLQIFSLNSGHEITDLDKYLADEIRRFEALPIPPVHYSKDLSELKSRIAKWKE